MKFLVINGPNLNLLGLREPDIYGSEDYAGLLEKVRRHCAVRRVAVNFYQSNHEGDLVDAIQNAYGTYDGIVINPGAFTHYSYAIHDALQSITTMPKVEIHISDITKREGFRAVSVTKPACDDQIYGKGFAGYLLAIDRVLALA